MRGHDIYRRKVLFDSDEMEGEEVVDSTPYMAYREVACNTMDEEDDKPLAPGERYVMIPSTFEPGRLGRFRIVLYTSAPLEQPQPLARLLVAKELLVQAHELVELDVVVVVLVVARHEVGRERDDLLRVLEPELQVDAARGAAVDRGRRRVLVEAEDDVHAALLVRPVEHVRDRRALV